MAGISGRVAQSARLGLEDILARKLHEETIAREEGQRGFENRLRLRKIAGDEQSQRDRMSLEERQLEGQERSRRDRANQAGLEQMGRDRGVFDEEQELRAASDMLASPDTPPALKRLIGLRPIGIKAQPSADMLMSEEERAAEETRGLKRVEQEAEIRGRVGAKYRAPEREPQAQRHPVPGPDGKIIYLTEDEINARGGVPATPRQRPVSGAERQARGFYTRMDEALQTMEQVEDGLSERDIAIINDSPLPDLLNNRMLSAAGQQYAQALKTYTEARLRKESGAAIAAHEFEADRRTIGRQVFDKPETIQQKRRTRRTTAEGVGAASGGAYEEFYGEPFRPGGRGGGGLKVRMQAPDGSIKEVDQSEVEHYQRMGAKVAGSR